MRRLSLLLLAAWLAVREMGIRAVLQDTDEAEMSDKPNMVDWLGCFLAGFLAFVTGLWFWRGDWRKLTAYTAIVVLAVWMVIR